MIQRNIQNSILQAMSDAPVVVLMRRLLSAAAILIFSLPLAGQPAVPAPTTSPAAVTEADINQFEPLFDRSWYVAAGAVDTIDAVTQMAHFQPKMQIYERDSGGGFLSGVSIPLTDADAIKLNEPGIFFVETGPDKKPQKFTFFPIEHQDKILAVGELWLEKQITLQLKTLEKVYKDDPDGDKPASVAAARRMYCLGHSQAYFPTYRDRKASHPARGHLAELFKIVNADLGIPCYLRTPEDQAKAIEVLKNASDSMVSGAATRAAARTFPDDQFDQMAVYFLYTRFDVFRDTLAAEDERIKSDLADWLLRIPDGDKIKPTRMNLFKALLAAQLQGKK